MPRTDKASRVIAAPPERVYAALVDPDALIAWLPPQGMKARFERFDPRPGGSYRLVLTYEDARSGRGKATDDSDVVEARFVSLVPGVCVVQEVEFDSSDPQLAGMMTMTWDIRSVGGGTLVEITADDVPDGISADEHAVGMASSLANLAEHLERYGVRGAAARPMPACRAWDPRGAYGAKIANPTMTGTSTRSSVTSRVACLRTAEAALRRRQVRSVRPVGDARPAEIRSILGRKAKWIHFRVTSRAK